VEAQSKKKGGAGKGDGVDKVPQLNNTSYINSALLTGHQSPAQPFVAHQTDRQTDRRTDRLHRRLS